MDNQILLQIVAEWLEESELPELAPRQMPPLDLPKLRSILAIVGSRRAGRDEEPRIDS